MSKKKEFVYFRHNTFIIVIERDFYASMTGRFQDLFWNEYDGFDLVTAAKYGRFFVFTQNGDIEGRSWLDRKPDAEPYVVGDWEDFGNLKKLKELRFEEVDADIPSPLSNVRGFGQADQEVCRVDGATFRKAFGDKRWTSMRPRTAD